MLRRYQRDAAQSGSVEIWLLLFAGLDATPMAHQLVQTHRTWQSLHGANVAIWSQSQMGHLYPKIEASIKEPKELNHRPDSYQSASYRQMREFFQRYWWFHTSLIVVRRDGNRSPAGLSH